MQGRGELALLVTRSLWRGSILREAIIIVVSFLVVGIGKQM